MKHLILPAALSGVLGLSAAVMNLEWNVRYDTHQPYEVEISPAKLAKLAGVPAGSGFVVKADGTALATTVLPGKAPGTVRLRFRVPAGTQALTCEAGVGQVQMAASKCVDNLFASALDAANLAKWSVPDNVKAEVVAGGILFSADPKTFKQKSYVSYTVDIPEGLAGAPVRQEIDVTGLGKLAWGGFIHVWQLDAAGHKLPESLCDGRWTSHMRPPKKLAQYRDEGHIHPKARKLVATFELRAIESAFDDYGKRITDPTVRLPKLLISHLAVRAGADLPFPKWDDACFAPGVSGAPGDTALRFGGEDGKALFYQTHSRGAWTDSVQFRQEEEVYFPTAAGTVEGWFKPDWAALNARRAAAKQETRPVVLFEAYQGYRAAQMLQGKGAMLQLRYRPVEKIVSVLMRDWQDHIYEKSFTQTPVDIPDGVWSHLALTWEPKKDAIVYLNGKPVVTLSIPEYEAIPIADTSIKNVNDLWAMEFFIGGSCTSARLSDSGPRVEYPLFEGLIDALRVSTGVRYPGAFTPTKDYSLDDATRAYFAFDRAFDGVSSGGFKFIPASYRRDVDRVDHVLVVDGKKVQYYPAQNLPENDPAQVLNILNYPVMPKPAEYLAATQTKSTSATLEAGGKMDVACGPVAYPEYVSFENLSQTKTLEYPILVNQGRLDPRSFGDLADSLGIQGLTDREKANRTFQYVLSASDYFMNHQLCLSAGTDVPHSACYEAMIMLNSYCGFECGPLNNMTANMLSTVAYCPASQTAGYGHSFQQVFYDGKNHIYDLSAQKFFPAMDNETAAYLKESGDQPAIHNRVKGSSDHFIRKSTRGTAAQNPSYQEKCAMVLNPGETFQVWYSNDGRMNNLQTWPRKGVYGSKGLTLDQYDFTEVAALDSKNQWVKRMDRIFPQYSTGILTRQGPVAKDNPALEQVKEDSFCYRVRSCYPIVWGEYAARDAAGKALEIDWSTDFGKTFRPLPRGANGVYTLEYRVKARHDYLLRVKAPLAKVADLSLRTEGEVNTRTYPGWVKGGANALTFKAEPGVAAKVTVAWREPVKDIVVKGGAYSGTIPGCERQVVLVDPSQTTDLEVAGASAAATVKTVGRVKATLVAGRLTLAYDATQPLAMTRGDDLEAWYASGDKAAPARQEFPTVAGVEIKDGEAVKRLTVIVSPNARFLPASAAKLTGAVVKGADADSIQDRIWFTKGSDKATFAYPKLPAGKYQVFAAARFASHPEKRGCSVRLVNPNPATAKKDPNYVLARYINGNEDYLKAHYGQKGGRARWKWDTINLEGKAFGQTGHSGWIIRTLDFPETDHLDFCIPYDNAEGVELAAVLVLPEADLECRADLRKILFGLNCDPFKVR